ncbi:MAG: PstS family phosphate ABC transporter substrate-binding protein [Candidatus Thiodiazotropha lotti]|uniref:Phosphate-binding protein n=2 Tax=Candidatus Thiodiazotropha endoloripes TaxID=1818881 RepID=A0A1E2USV4_9GAMM|nr:PstS family phosphate ABC transporter substrate-binding protein [Candidatus Thiodiazotropha endoloripes]MCG7898501.1 PstS family phosphate ABC transporter substrate-binding protein [Candidatus Thiodiazotropha weberae]MCG7990625.1 PstS family phosphate ABC transporter substrate-binding protein [Candidatus Thiodiazotropha lotti]MCG7904365.1 PstS family phosphate ABC transporter substrate-binding protein [Candidatus Thiodiazotropha weberae]MCG7915691.1 PstS family phosphate ABC transporter subs
MAAALLLFSAQTVNAADRTVVQNKGSDTLVNVAQAWAEEYGKIDSKVAIAVSGGGSGTGIAAMINGTVDIANASRKMKSKEIKLAEKKGQSPIEHVVGYDALAVFIHSNNPATEFNYDQLKAVFARGGKATKWSDLGLSVPGCKSDKIVVVSRQNNSGTYAYFKKAVLGKKGKFRQGTLDMHGSKDVVDLVEKTPCAIGYSGLAYATDHIKMACIAKQAGETCVNPSVSTASDRSYPIARPLLMYTNGEPAGKIKEYMDWVKSDVGQCILKKKGYAPTRDVSCN